MVACWDWPGGRARLRRFPKGSADRFILSAMESRRDRSEVDGREVEVVVGWKSHPQTRGGMNVVGGGRNRRTLDPLLAGQI